MTGTPIASHTSARNHELRTGFRADIEGLRALAVMLVIAYHAGWRQLPGGYVGVDVFFVISGFLITGLIVREVEQTGRLRLARFYARRIRRLLPASILVLVAITVATVVFLPSIRWNNIAGDVVNASTYIVNWRFADRAVDYLAEGSAASPVLHFWSLAVEEQFYVVWPLVIIAVARLKPKRIPVRQAMLGGLAVIAVPSFAWSVYLTAEVAGRAYFVTPTRMWELAVGGFAALAVPWLPRPTRFWATAMGGGAVAAIVLAGNHYNAATAFPGAAAALPVLATGLALAIGAAAPTNIATRALGVRPLRFIGGMSYSLYLWHWPAVVVALAVFPEANTGMLSAAVALSFVPAWISHHLVENPIRYSDWIVDRPRRAIQLGILLTATGVAAGLALGALIPNWSTDDIPETSTGPVEFDGPIDVNAVPATIVPDPAVANRDLASVYDRGCHQTRQEAEPIFCEYGEGDARTRIALVGDSHAAQWVPAFEAIVEQRDWYVRSYTKAGCVLADVRVSPDGKPYDSCEEWKALVVDDIDAWDPDYVVTSGFHLAPVLSGDSHVFETEREQLLATGYERTWLELETRGLSVVVIQDPPAPGPDVAECVSMSTANPAQCNVPMAVANEFNTSQATAAAKAGIPIVDLTSWICTDDTCPAVVGEILVWRGANHLTATYSRLLAPYLDHGLTAAFE